MDAGQNSLHPFVHLSREDWARLPADASFALSEDDVREIGAYLSPEEAREVYLPYRGSFTFMWTPRRVCIGQHARSWPKRRKRCPTSSASQAASPQARARWPGYCGP